MAQRLFGAQNGRSEGHTGSSYAIPTVDTDFEVRSLEHIKQSVDRFIAFAKEHPELKFIVTPIGCGIAGLKPEKIAPMFNLAPANCDLPKEFKI